MYLQDDDACLNYLVNDVDMYNNDAYRPDTADAIKLCRSFNKTVA